MSKYDEVLKPFVQMMEAELHANTGKGDRPGWLSMSSETCLLEIYYHVGKLQKAVKDSSGDGICEYAADVANMSMMLVDICGGLGLCAAPVPPAGDVEVLASLGLTLAVLNEAFNAQDSAERLSNMNVPRVMRGAFKDFERIKTEFTRLTAERDAMASKLETMRRKNNELNDTEARLTAERDGLLAEVEQLKRWQATVRENSPLLIQLDALQSELTEALELLVEGQYFGPFHWQKRTQMFLANQSAPAAKGGE